MRRVIPPRLDDRSFGQLRDDAIKRIQAVCPEWIDFSPSDPGIALAEVFAYLTQTLLYRVNRVPEKQYRAFLDLLGVTELPPSAATTTLVFSRAEKGGVVEIPRGTKVAAEGVVFSTARPVRMAKKDTEVEVPAFHGELIEGELVGMGTGAPGLEVSVRRPPIVAPMDDHLELVVAVEETEPLPHEARAVQFEGKTFRVWREVANFAEIKADERVFVTDRRRGLIRFAPTAEIGDARGQLQFGEGAVGAIPPTGREIRVSYRTGGGAQGNVRPQSLTTLKDRIAGVNVTNPRPATGGRDAESLDDLLVRGPTDFHRLERAVTARDYETLARRAGGIARAKAFTESEIWRHAPPGVVETVIVPTAESGPLSIEDLRRQETPEELAKVQRALDAARPLGSRCEVHWTRYKPVSIKLRAVVSPLEDQAAVRTRILKRLELLISPLPRSAWDQGWPHGRALRRYDVEGTVRAEPGVVYVTGVELVPDRMPRGEVVTLGLDGFQPRTCFAGAENTIFRTINAGDGWELVKEFPKEPPEQAEKMLIVRPSYIHAGHVAAMVQVGNGDGRRTYLSRDCGETWQPIGYSETAARDLAWSDRDGTPLLFFATDKGLHEFLLDGHSSPVPVEIDGRWDRGLISVVETTDARGNTYVAVASNDRTGVFLSRNGGASGSFTPLGLTQSLSELAIQREGVRSFLWAGFADPDRGAARYELDLEAAKEGWVDFSAGWGEAGSCLALAFTRDGRALAGSYSHGVLWLVPQTGEQWQRPPLDWGLPIRDEEVQDEKRLFFPMRAVVVDRSLDGPEMDRILVGSQRGVYRSPSPNQRYEAVTQLSEFAAALRETITLPPTWLFCSGQHEVEVVTENGGEDQR
jgi:hypothetical protein